MRGCLTLPFRLLGLALLVLAGYVAWTYRREIRRQVHQWTAEPAAPRAGTGTASPRTDAGAIHRRLDRLKAGADSVVLTAAELAVLGTELAGSTVPGALDSVEVRLDRDDVEIRARVDTRKVPVSLGPLSMALRDHEYVETGGRLVFRRAGVAEWELERVRVRGLPVPMSFVSDQIRRVSPRAVGRSVPIKLPAGVTGLRVTERGITLYGRAGAGAAP